MSHKNQKKIIALLLIFIFAFTSCLSNLTFAASESDGLEIV